MDVLDPMTKTLSFPSLNSSSSSSEEEEEEMAVVEEEPQAATNKRKLLSKQLSMRETTREAKWEKRRQQVHDRRARRMMTMAGAVCEEDDAEEEEEEEERERRRRGRVRSLTDEDLDELRGSIELGFGFDEENGGHDLRDTLPALDLYFAVNRQLSDPKLGSSSSPTGTSSTAAGTPSPRSPYAQEQRNSNASDSWKICSPGDDPQHVKMRLRQWAQVVACSVRQSC